MPSFRDLWGRTSDTWEVKKTPLDNIGKYCKPGESGEIVLDVETSAPIDPEDAHAGREISLSWLLNLSLSCASATLRRFKSQEEAKEDADLWDIARRALQKYFVAKDPCRPAAHARGAPEVASSWISELVDGPGIGSDITDCVPGDENYIFGRVAEEFHAVEREMAFGAGNITTDFGAIPCDITTTER